MTFGAIDHFLTGVAVPLTALRSEKSVGIGEFADLKTLADWCSDLGIELIQLLPVNDTGYDLSPYGALSAFALHPALVRLEDIEGAESFSSEIASFRAERSHDRAVAYREVLAFKNDMLRRIFANAAEEIRSDQDLTAWIEANPWVKPYAVFHILKARNGGYAWFDWPEHRQPTGAFIDEFWRDAGDEALYHAWLQRELERQFSDAVRHLESRGVRLKGDIPILMSVDSADVWAYRDYFEIMHRAGAPPDMFSTSGQNWGFPVYNWEALAKHDYAWWKERLAQADKFYHAYRIDHVLGFFRIWRVPASEKSGLLGHFYPFNFITRAELYDAGFDDGLIRWLSVPHVPEHVFEQELGREAGRVKERYFDRQGNEPLFNLKGDVEGEHWILGLDEPEEIKRFLVSWHQNRTFLEVAGDTFFPHWYYEDTHALSVLDDELKNRVKATIARHYESSENVWEEHGYELLSMLKSATPMLVCAEDLGVVPQCVPEVLSRLNILSLKIERWARRYGEPGDPYIDPQEYPFLSVCTPSVHDTSTLRGWWEEDGDREEYYRLIGGEGPLPDEMTVELAERIAQRNMDSSSLICAFQIQDYLALDESTRLQTPDEERINVPSEEREMNWKYRMPLTIESLIENQRLNEKLKSLISRRTAREAVVEAA